MKNYIISTFFNKKIENKSNKKVLTLVSGKRDILSVRERQNIIVKDDEQDTLSGYFNKISGLNSQERLKYLNIF